MKLDGIKRGLLFVLPILFGLCFNCNYTNGVAYTVNTEYDFPYTDINVSFEFDDSVNYLYNNPIVFAGSKCNASTIFWNDSKLGFITLRSFNTANCNQEAGVVVQGYFTKICKLPYTDASGCINDGRMDYGGCNLATKCSGKRVDIQDFYDYTGSINTMSFYSGYYASYNRTFCFNYIDDNISYCVFTNLNKSTAWPNEYTGNDFTTVSNYDSLLNYESPSPYSPRTTVSSNSGAFDNLTAMGGAEQIYNAYALEGYERAMCYGGYPLTDLVNTSNGIDLSGFKSGTGASLNEIYEATSGGMSKVDRYNSNFAYFTYAYRSNDYNIFNGDPYALLGLMSIKRVIKPGASASSVVAFCDLVQNGVWSGSAIDLINESVENLQYQQLIGEIGVNVPASGSAIDLMVKSLQDQGYLTGFSFSNVFSGSEDESITTIRSRRDELYEKISGGLSVPAGFNGILPGYIAMGFLAFLLLYLFKK